MIYTELFSSSLSAFPPIANFETGATFRILPLSLLNRKSNANTFTEIRTSKEDTTTRGMSSRIASHRRETGRNGCHAEEKKMNDSFVPRPSSSPAIGQRNNSVFNSTNEFCFSYLFRIPWRLKSLLDDGDTPSLQWRPILPLFLSLVHRSDNRKGSEIEETMQSSLSCQWLKVVIKMHAKKFLVLERN